jgi:hypothetical protein
MEAQMHHQTFQKRGQQLKKIDHKNVKFWALKRHQTGAKK